MSEEKREEATPKTERRARERGRVWLSRDLVLAGVLGTTSMLVEASRASIGARLSALVRAPLDAITTGGTPTSVAAQVATDGALLLAPLLAAIVAMAALASVVQIGPLFATRAVSADGARLDPTARLGDLFGTRSGATLGMTLVRLVLATGVALFTLHDALPGIATLSRQTPAAALDACFAGLGALTMRLAIAMAGLGIVDAVLERFLYRASLRMSRRDRERERRESEGDEHLRRERDRVRDEARAHDVALSTTEARLVIEDEELAIALRYDASDLDAVPHVAAAGRGAVADQLRTVARDAGVPSVTDASLAAQLAIVPLGHPIPEALYEPVARWMHETREAMR